ncbi:related to dehydrogenase/reductase SDR family member 7 precursor [Cephalotrichum gorgonifer]|uniref:Related to dehydrogenase/reductase SDR family member 7 n=1 Tax=Cephalotrichum gorgonifer TaxID=2041049 RepID=A0AAE8N6E7_9PEZI|nr:related to dehydrogenase/reductase SDR family member 7 precursor [Cephalotrichum gorgonifer]
MANWGTQGAGQFTATTYSDVHPAIDPTQNQLPARLVVCVIGASRGIGAGIAAAYAKAGVGALVLAARRTSGLEETASVCRAINPRATVAVIPTDITSAQSVSDLAGRVQSQFNRLDALAINSGYSGPCIVNLTDVDPITARQASEVNYLGTLFAAKYFIPLLLDNPDGAKIFIAVSSMASLIVRGPIANAQYCVSKMAQLKLMEHIHEKYSGQGLSAYSVHPGAVASEMALDNTPESFMEYLVDSPELCGAFCTWLTAGGDKMRWLSGRLLSAKWDVAELELRQEEIASKDILKTKLAV